MPLGKPAGVRCVQLDETQACRLFGQASRPEVCRSLRPEAAMCGPDAGHALAWLNALEAHTRP
jgi:uncharacterized protein